jgi:hypothetical protein
VVTLHVGTDGVYTGSDNDIAAAEFIREMSAELGVSPSRLELIMR